MVCRSSAGGPTGQSLTSSTRELLMILTLMTVLSTATASEESLIVSSPSVLVQ